MIRRRAVPYKLGGGKNPTGTCGFRIDHRKQKLVEESGNIIVIVVDRQDHGNNGANI